MLSVLLIWLYMAVTTFFLGYGILTAITHFCTYQVRKWDSYFWCGLAAATVYAQFFSLFAPVGLAANIGLVCICIGIVFACRKKLAKEFRCFPSVGVLLLILLYAYGTSRGILHYDTGLYHAQSIRWLEEYGAVAGLGNLHCRLAYNSASFALSALYSMSFLGGQSYHCAAGFLALLLAVECLKITEIFRWKHLPEQGKQIFPKRTLKTSDFARVTAIYYLLVIFDEMVSPASDYFMVLTAFYLVIRWLDLLEEEEQESLWKNRIFPYAMLCVLGVFLMTIKLSAALIILLVIQPACLLIREKKWKETGIYLGLGILTAIPFLIRNVILSGWLVYPFTSIDFFAVDWKIPKGIAAYDAKEIQVWGRGYSDVTRFDIPIWEWLPDWFAGLGGMDKLFVLAALAAVGICILRVLFYAVNMCLQRHKKEAYEKEAYKQEEYKQEAYKKLLVEVVMSICFLFWLFSSPLIRYGCVYVYLVSAVVFGDVCTEWFASLSRQNIKQARWKHFFAKKGERIFIVVIGLFLLYKAAAFGKELVGSYVNDYWVCQKDYENYETTSYEIDGITFYYPVTGDKVGYESFPSSPTKAKIALRGNGIEDGFMAVP